MSVRARIGQHVLDDAVVPVPVDVAARRADGPVVDQQRVAARERWTPSIDERERAVGHDDLLARPGRSTGRRPRRLDLDEAVAVHADADLAPSRRARDGTAGCPAARWRARPAGPPARSARAYAVDRRRGPSRAPALASIASYVHVDVGRARRALCSCASVPSPAPTSTIRKGSGSSSAAWQLTHGTREQRSEHRVDVRAGHEVARRRRPAGAS